MALGRGFWHLVTWIFFIGAIGSISTVLLFAIELVRVAISKDHPAENYTPQDTIC